jgi:hypothetical protein
VLFFFGQAGTTTSTSRLPVDTGTYSRAEMLAAFRNVVDWKGKEGEEPQA